MQKSRAWRYMSIAVLFCLVSVLYLGRLFYIQISGRDGNYNDKTTTRTVTIRAVRGEIYDRNGKPLVTNRYIYDLSLSHASFSALGHNQANRTMLALLDALNRTNEQHKHEEKFDPFSGTYPSITFSTEATDGTSATYYRLKRVLNDLGLKENTSAEKLVNYYIDTYALLATGSDGTPLWSNSEIDRLIRLRYNMDALRFSEANDYIFAQNVSMHLMTYVREQGLGGVTFQFSVERVYNYPGYASHILGTVGPIYAEEWSYYNEQGYQMNAMVGKTGCELSFESYLRGSDGEMEIVEDANGNTISTKITKQPIAGSDIRLTIDIDLQIAAEDGLAENIASIGGNCQSGAAVAIDPNTFDVLAIASYPTYDLGLYNQEYEALSQNEAKPLINRALNGLYAPGSTFKPGVAAAALMSNNLEPYETITCNGRSPHYHSPKCSTYENGTHGGSINIIEAIADSCNTFFYELGYRMGIKTMNEFLSNLGFGKATGVELGGATGALAGPDYRIETNSDPWQPGDVLSAAIGQSDNMASPLQLACYAATLANGGTRYSAHLLHSVYTFGQAAPTYSYQQTEATILGKAEISAEALGVIEDGMRAVVTNNNIVNRNMRNVPVAVGAKTGTAQNASGDDNSLFICTAPFDSPSIAISVVLEQGRAGSNASLTAARILEQFYGVSTQP